jgi:hypothetical protein
MNREFVGGFLMGAGVIGIVSGCCFVYIGRNYDIYLKV